MDWCLGWGDSHTGDIYGMSPLCAFYRGFFMLPFIDTLISLMCLALSSGSGGWSGVCWHQDRCDRRMLAIRDCQVSGSSVDRPLMLWLQVVALMPSPTWIFWLYYSMNIYRRVGILKGDGSLLNWCIFLKRSPKYWMERICGILGWLRIWDCFIFWDTSRWF